MTRISTAGEKLKMKLALSDYPIKHPLSLKDEETKIKAKKIYAIKKEDMEKLKQIYEKRLNGEEACSISQILSNAIELLYEQELTQRSNLPLKLE